MPKQKKSDNNSSFPKKWLNKLPDGHVEKAEAMSADELKAAIVQYEQEISQSEKDKEADIALTDAKEKVKDLSGAYNEFISMKKAEIKFAVHVLESRGAA